MIYALHAGLCEQPFFDKSNFPAWAKKVIERANNPPAVDFSKTYESIKDTNQAVADDTFNKADLAKLKFAKIELYRLA